MSSSALVVADGAANDAARAPEEDAELPVDLSQLPMIPMPKSLLLINNFVANTTRFLNHFAFECEDRIARVSSNLTRVEVMLAILEAKLNSIPDLTVTDAEVEAAGRSMAGGDSASAASAAQVDIGISDQDLPSMETGAGAPPPPPPPPPSDGGALVELPPPPPPGSVVGEEDGAMVVAPPPPPPPPGLEDGEDEAGPEAPPDLPSPPAGEEPTFLKLKDDPVYAKYFTMRRLGIPDQVIEHKLLMDGMDTGILTMDPEGPSPSGGAAPTVAEPSGPMLPIMAPPSVMSDSDDDSDDASGLPPPPPPPPPASATASRPPSGNIGLPFPPPPPPLSPTSSVSSRPESLFGGLPPPPPPGTVGLPPPPLPPFDPDDDDSSSDDDIEEIVVDPPSSQPEFLKLKDDPAFSKYFKMRKLGMPDGVIQHKLMMDGVTVDILSMDPEGPSPNAASGSAPTSGPAPVPTAAAPTSALPPPPPPPAGRPGLPPPPVPKYTGSDDDSDFSD